MGLVTWIGIAVGAIVVVVLLQRASGGVDSDELRAQMRAEFGGDLSVESLVAAGRKIDAIKLYRAEHGVGLREAKEAVDSLALGRARS